MKTVNGIGTRLLSWRKRDDGTSLATKWFCFVFMPIVPLATLRVRVTTPPERAIGLREAAMAISPHKTLTDSYEIIGQCQMDWRAIGKTYLFAWIIRPTLITAPLLGLLAFSNLASPEVRSGKVFLYAIVIYILLWMGMSFAYLASLLHKSRGL